MLTTYLIGLEIQKKEGYKETRNKIGTISYNYINYLNGDISENFEKCINLLDSQFKLLNKFKTLKDELNEIQNLLKEYKEI